MKKLPARSAVVIVAHPDDEVLWAGGFMLIHPDWDWHVVCTCRKSDPDRAPRFWRVMDALHCSGSIGDLDDGPEQHLLPAGEVEAEILHLLPSRSFDLILTHHPNGEYTRHIRHEEVSQAVIALWQSKVITAPELWVFAYTDHQKTHLPRAMRFANVNHVLPQEIWEKKYGLITRTYGFGTESFEALTTPKEEAFWILNEPGMVRPWPFTS